MKYIRWFAELSKADVGIAGGKGANLGELTRAGAPVPPGFVVLATAYYAFLDHNQLRPQIFQLLSGVDTNDTLALNQASDKIRQILQQSEFPPELTRQIIHSYHALGSPKYNLSPHPPVAVRSSATAEDLPEASFAGQQESYLNVVGDANVLMKVKECYMSLFGARSIFYRAQQNFDHFKVGIAVPIQAMIQSEVSGVMFSVDPISRNKDTLVIEAAFGLGDFVVQGVVTPDHYEYSKSSGQITLKQIARQEIMEVRSEQGVKQVPVAAGYEEVQKLPDEKIVELAQIGLKIHQHYFFPQDMEWAYADNQLYITQARPITTLEKPAKTTDNTQAVTAQLGDPILKGAPASPGLVSGPVRVVTSIKELAKVRPGDILVTEMTTPDFVPAMKRAAGIVTDKGGLTSHAAIVSRELGVACVVGTATASKVLKDGMNITLNGQTGEVFKGAITLQSHSLSGSQRVLKDSDLNTATKLYVNLAEPELAQKVSQLHVDGVGLLRAEFMIAGIGTHPKKMLADGRAQEFIDQLADNLAEFCRCFHPRPVVYRATDFKTNEYRSLKGGEAYEPEESNPMLGFRGAYRYVKTPEVFNLELEAIKKVRHKLDFKNLHLMIPFVSTVKELVEVKKLVAAAGLYRSSNFKLWMMVEIPANVILLDEFIDVGIDGVSIGSNDLTMLILGIDRDNAEVAPNFDERNPAVMWALEKTVTTCARRAITCSICGQAPSEYPELVEKLVEWGITSISVNPDRIAATRQIIHAAEEKHILSQLKK